jgi:hypothetical protein
MSDAAKKAVDKLTIIKAMAQSPETQQVAKVMIEYIQDKEKGEGGAGFNGSAK